MKRNPETASSTFGHDTRSPSESATWRCCGEVSLQRRLYGFLRERGIEGIDDLLIEADGGMVVLRGQVPTSAIKRACVECCRRAPGVAMLTDEIEVTVPIRPR